MKDHEIRELVNQLRDVAIKYHGAGQLREQIARTVRAAMLQAGALTNEGTSLQDNHSVDDTEKVNSPLIPNGYVMVPDDLKEAAADLLATLDDYQEQLVPINRDSSVVRALRAAMLAAAQQEVKGE